MFENPATPALRPSIVAARVETILERARGALEADPKRALEGADQARRLAESIDDRGGLAQSLELLGLAHARQGAQDLALEHLHWALLVYKETGDQNGVASCTAEIGHVHVALEDNPATSTDYREIPDAAKHPSRWGRDGQDFQRIAALFALCDYHTANLEHLLARLNDERELGKGEGVPHAFERVGFSYLELGRHQYDEVLRYMLRALAGSAARSGGSGTDAGSNALEYAVRAFAQTSRRLRSPRTFELALAVAKDMDEYRRGVDDRQGSLDPSALRLPQETVRYLERAAEVAQSIRADALKRDAEELLDKARALRDELPESLARTHQLEVPSPQLELDFAEYDPPELRPQRARNMPDRAPADPFGDAPDGFPDDLLAGTPDGMPADRPDNILDSLEERPGKRGGQNVYDDALEASKPSRSKSPSPYGAITTPVAVRVHDDPDVLHTHVPLEPVASAQHTDLIGAAVAGFGGLVLMMALAGRSPIVAGLMALCAMLGAGYLVSSALLPRLRPFERIATAFGFGVGLSPFVVPILNNAASDRRYLILGLILAALAGVAVLVAYRRRLEPAHERPIIAETVWSGLASQVFEDFDDEERP